MHTLVTYQSSLSISHTQSLPKDLTPLSQRRKLLQCIILLMVLYIFPLGILCKVISLTPVIMFLTTLDHLLVQTICFHLLFHLLFLCGIAYETMLKFPHFLFLRLMYHISMTATYVAFCPLFYDINFSSKKRSICLQSIPCTYTHMHTYIIQSLQDSCGT